MVQQTKEEQELINEFTKEDTPTRLDWVWIHRLIGNVYWLYAAQPDNEYIKLLKTSVGNNDIRTSFSLITKLIKGFNDGK